EEDLTGWLAVAKISMGFPLFALALLVIVWAVRRSDKRLAEAIAAERRTEAEIEADLRARYGETPAQERGSAHPSDDRARATDRWAGRAARPTGGARRPCGRAPPGAGGG